MPGEKDRAVNSVDSVLPEWAMKSFFLRFQHHAGKKKKKSNPGVPVVAQG